MGFLENMANEAGKKTGKAIGNKLFGRYADDMRVGYGEVDGSGRAAAKQVKAEGREERKRMKLQDKLDHQSDIRQQIAEIQSLEFNTQDVKSNVNVLLRLLSISETELDVNNYETAELQKQLKELSLKKLKMGINLCKAIAPSDASISMVENMMKEKEQEKQQAEEAKKKEDKKGTIIVIAGLGIFILFIIIMALCLG